MGGDKRLTARHGSLMADAIINIADRSLAARYGSCMADVNLHILDSWTAAGHGNRMAVTNPTTVHTAKTTKYIVLLVPGTGAWKPPVGLMADIGTISTSGPATPAEDRQTKEQQKVPLPPKKKKLAGASTEPNKCKPFDSKEAN
ncbi:hypothetical protein E2C01_089989 [Portunus trituberculatus]|uniref:Uncharacterized protein n=1 Tax=Portunus trituberculatus TaxID=210409 RepID=A0A5B7JK88_PORTR|nr:hypothetical protein [Portunus trituberculatus]